MDAVTDRISAAIFFSVKDEALQLSELQQHVIVPILE